MPVTASGTAERSPTTLRILLAEDNPVNQRVALGLLKQIGCTSAVMTNNGREAVDALETTEYDVVLMDIQMPEMDGLEATREIRRRWPDGPRRPYIIAMTANAMTGDREKCLEAGMDDYISKPVKSQSLEKLPWNNAASLRAAVAAVATHTDHHGATPAANAAVLNRDSLEALKSLQSEGDDGFLKEMIELFLADTPLALRRHGRCTRRRGTAGLRPGGSQHQGSQRELRRGRPARTVRRGRTNGPGGQDARFHGKAVGTARGI